MRAQIVVVKCADHDTLRREFVSPRYVIQGIGAIELEEWFFSNSDSPASYLSTMRQVDGCVVTSHEYSGAAPINAPERRIDLARDGEQYVIVRVVDAEGAPVAIYVLRRVKHH